MAHAHAMRAEVRLEIKEYDEAVRDAKVATDLDATNDKAWRALADAQEAAGNVQGAVRTLQQWSKVCPAFSTKAIKEIQRLKERL